jgi:hypothetical protein
MCKNKEAFERFADSFDNFAVPTPAFTMKGREKIYSFSSLFASIILYICLLAFSLYSVVKRNPIIMTVSLLDQNTIDGEGILFDASKEFYAISMVGKDGLIKHSSKYLEFNF